MKKTLLVVLALTFAMVGCQSKKFEVKTEDEKTAYALGSMLGMRFQNLNLSENELNALTQGVVDAATKAKPQVEAKDYQMKIQKFIQDKMSATSSKVKEGGKKFIEDFVKKEGGKQTSSGLAYKVLKEGKGKAPKATDNVEVHYHGTLIDGTVFDSSVDRGQTVTFPLNRVIKGWTEGVQLIKEGGKIRLVIPSELAYGDRGAPPKIPGGATLVFDVELFKIKDAPKAPKAAKKGKKK